MAKVSKLLIIITILFLWGCGKAKRPTGGPEDKIPLKIITISPETFNSISERVIEIEFNKFVDRSSIENAFQFYPELKDVDIKLDDKTITLTINDDLLENRNYYFTILTLLKDDRNNYLENNRTYVYSNGKLQEGRISGKILYEKREDSDKESKLVLLDADSVKVFITPISGSTYAIDGLETNRYVVRSFIDHNNNGLYDVEKEPYFEAITDSLKIRTLDIEFAYDDTSKVVVKRATAIYNNLVKLRLSEEAKAWKSISIMNSADSTDFPLGLVVKKEEELFLVTAPQDTIDYLITLKELADNNNNITEEYKVAFHGSTKIDTLRPEVTTSFPRSGSTVLTLKPNLIIGFNEIILEDDIVVQLKELESGKLVDLEIAVSNSHKVVIVPKRDLLNFNSYELILSKQTTDMSDNHLLEEYVISFMVTSRD